MSSIDPWPSGRKRYRHLVDEPTAGEVEQRYSVEVREATAALVVGPDDVLVIVVDHAISEHDGYLLRRRLLDSKLAPDQILIVAGEGAAIAGVQRRTES